MPHRADELEPSLMPLIDIIFSVIGIFIIVLAYQSLTPQEAQRRVSVDSLFICTDNQQVRLYLNPQEAPTVFAEGDLSQLFQRLAQPPLRSRNFVLAFNQDCFDLQSKVVVAFERYTSTLADQPVAFRLSLYPLHQNKAAETDLVHRWTTGESLSAEAVRDHAL